MKHIAIMGILLLAAIILTGCAGTRRAVAVENTYEFDERIVNIKISTTACDVRIVPSGDGKCRVVCKEADTLIHDVDINKGTLSIKKRNGRSGIITNIPLVIEVSVPAVPYGTLSIDTTSGSQDISSGISFTDAWLTSSSGGIRTAADVEGSLNIRTTSGSQSISGASAPEIAAESTSGSILAEDMNAAENLFLKSSSGNVTLREVVSSASLKIETTSGDIRLIGCDSPSVRISATSGDVEAELLSGKKFRVRTTSGSASFPEDSAGGTCEIETTSGDVTVRTG